MLRKLLIIWFPMAATAGVAFCTWGMSPMAARIFRAHLGGKPLPGLTVLFYESSTWPYLFPIPIFLLAVLLSFRKKDNADNATVLAVATLSVTLLFLVIWLVAAVLPFIPIVSPMSAGPGNG